MTGRHRSEQAAGPRVGSLFTGVGGFDLALAEVLDAHPVWFSENADAPAKILAARWPDVPNLGDITAVDWAVVEPVDVLTGGFPCQDVSQAGKRAGLHASTRTGLWAAMLTGITELRPGLVLLENVRGLMSARGDEPTTELIAARALTARIDAELELLDGTEDHEADRVRLLEQRGWAVAATRRADARIIRAIGTILGSLADIGYDAQWRGLPASDIGAPHARFRIFIAAWPAAADADDVGHQRSRGTWDRRPGSADAGLPAADAAGARRGDAEDSGPDRDDAGEGRGSLEPERADRELDEPPAPDAGVPGLEGRDADLGPEAADAVSRRRGVLGFGDSGGVGWKWNEVVAEARDGLIDEDASTTGISATEGLHSLRGGSRGETESDEASCGCARWGRYAAAIHRWEMALDRIAPPPTVLVNGKHRLAPRAVEFLMGFPEGHVTDVPGLTRSHQIRALGNGCVPQQAAEAVRFLIESAAAS